MKLLFTFFIFFIIATTLNYAFVKNFHCDIFYADEMSCRFKIVYHICKNDRIKASKSNIDHCQKSSKLVTNVQIIDNSWRKSFQTKRKQQQQQQQLLTKPQNNLNNCSFYKEKHTYHFGIRNFNECKYKEKGCDCKLKPDNEDFDLRIYYDIKNKTFSQNVKFTRESKLIFPGLDKLWMENIDTNTADLHWTNSNIINYLYDQIIYNISYFESKSNESNIQHSFTYKTLAKNKEMFTMFDLPQNSEIIVFITMHSPKNIDIISRWTLSEKLKFTTK